jgi:hypothetical protein
MSQIHKALAVLETSAPLILRRWPMADGPTISVRIS